MSEDFDRSRLSAREDEILELAIEGLTDYQIALKLNISPSTVNSYWVRIRGKLGHLSRTELVATSLRMQAKSEIERLSNHTKRIEELVLQGQRDDLEVQRGELHRVALEAVPEALLVTDENGQILFANGLLETLFAYENSELLGEAIERILPGCYETYLSTQSSRESATPTRLTLGTTTVLYGVRKDRSQFRVVLLLDSRDTSTGFVTTCLVRGFMDEIEFVRQKAAATVAAFMGPVRRAQWKPTESRHVAALQRDQTEV